MPGCRVGRKTPDSIFKHKHSFCKTRLLYINWSKLVVNINAIIKPLEINIDQLRVCALLKLQIRHCFEFCQLHAYSLNLRNTQQCPLQADLLKQA
jgi:hypothetical protein